MSLDSLSQVWGLVQSHVRTLRAFSTILLLGKDLDVFWIVRPPFRERDDVVKLIVFHPELLAFIIRISIELLKELCPRQALALGGNVAGSFPLAEKDNENDQKDERLHCLVVHGIPRSARLGELDDLGYS